MLMLGNCGSSWTPSLLFSNYSKINSAISQKKKKKKKKKKHVAERLRGQLHYVFVKYNLKVINTKIILASHKMDLLNMSRYALVS